MIGLEISKLHSENIAHLNRIDVQNAKIEARIIGIDGNGTGRIGALQRQDLKLAELGDAQQQMDEKLDTVLTAVHNLSSVDKKDIWDAVRWMFGTILVILGLMLGYMTYRVTAHPNLPIAVHAMNHNLNAEN